MTFGRPERRLPRRLPFAFSGFSWPSPSTWQRTTAAWTLTCLLALAWAASPAWAQGDKERERRTGKPAPARKATPAKPVAQKTTRPVRVVRPVNRDGEAEARLIEIYRLIGQAKTREALPKAEKLVREHPTFQLAQLVYGDLLAAQLGPLKAMGAVPADDARQAGPLLADLREESLLRLRALRERPADGLVPSQFLELSSRNRHAIAVDASKSRLYLFENSAAGLKLVGDYYISVGKSGIEKMVEGDLRTPLGVYFITSNLDPKSLKDFYGSGALPINYPNQLDLRRGKTGSGIWLHGTPPNQFSRAPLATDGCVVLANPDLERIIRTVETRTTPVVIAKTLKWVAPQAAKADGKAFEEAFKGWHSAKSGGDMTRLSTWYAPDFTSDGKNLAQWMPSLRGEMAQLAGREVQLKDVSYLRWTDSADTMVVTFAELASGSRTGRTKRQYWTRLGGHWKIFYEGIIG